MILQTVDFCDLYKIGLESGKKYHDIELYNFFNHINVLSIRHNFKIYWKDTLLKTLKIQREYLTKYSETNCVNRDYNLFTNE
jgi:hypothetical protein